MKIVCQSCSATYKIADEKVQGKKVFKIKCKKCGEDILVRGTDLPAASPAPVDEGIGAGEAIWHAVVNGDQQGPFSVSQLQEMLATGVVDSETYVWREGFEGWLPIVQVDELGSLLNPAAAVSDAFPSAAPEEAASGGDLFASLVPPVSDPAPAAASGLFGALDAEPAAKPSPASLTAKTRPVKPAGGDLFAIEARQQEAARPLFAEEPAGVREPSRAESLTGQRNENSVLFSLATLQQLSGDEKGSANVGAPKDGDSSGLIDINKLSGALNLDKAAKKSSVDDILSVGASSGLGSPLSAPVLAPIALPVAAAPVPAPAPAPAQQKNNPMIWVAVAGILGVTAVAVALIVKRNDEAPAAPTVAQATTPAAPAAPNPNGVTPPSTAPGATPEAVNPPPGATTPTPTPPPGATSPTPTPAAANAERPRERDRERDRDRERSRPSAAAPAPTVPAPVAAPARPAPAPAAPVRPRGPSGSVDDLMNAVVTGRPAGGGPATAPASASNVPESPARTEVVAALRGVSPAVRACGSGQGGVATVNIVFNSSGSVNTATLQQPVPGVQPSCIVSAVRRAHVAPFSRPTFSVTYPFALQ